ncbi:MAG: type VI secretion system baseplate subunit TssG [Myxococcaceae bacterium]
MDPNDKSIPAALATWVEQHGPRMSFFALAKLLEQLTPDAAAVGRDGPPSAEAIFFRHDPALTFSSGDVSQIRFHAKRDPHSLDKATPPLFDVTSTFLGLSGASTPLPHYIAEEIAHEQSDAHPQRGFLDLFHHRLISLLFRAVLRYDVTAETRLDARDDWSKRLLALGGFDTYGSELEPGLDAGAMLQLVSLLSLRTRTAETLTHALNTLVGPHLQEGRFEIEEFVPDWVAIDERTQLGVKHNRLGDTCILGARCLDGAGKVRIHVGPLSQQDYLRLVPGGDLLGQVESVVRAVASDPLAFDLELTFAPREAPKFQLSTQPAVKLGQDIWLGRTDHMRVSVISPSPALV